MFVVASACPRPVMLWRFVATVCFPTQCASQRASTQAVLVLSLAYTRTIVSLSVGGVWYYSMFPPSCHLHDLLPSNTTPVT